MYTTIDLNMQRLARKAIEEILDEPGDPASAIVTINPANGDIEAMAESESYEQSQYNLAADGHRQPGSTFKAIDLADALTRGINPNSTYYFSHTLHKGWLSSEPNYEVKTFEGLSLNKWINLVQATLTSDNTVYAQLADDLGESSITSTADAMGVKDTPRRQPCAGARRAEGPASRRWKWRSCTRRSLTAAGATRRSRSRRSSSRTATSTPAGAAAPHARAQRSGDSGGDEHPRGQRPRRHSGPLSDQLPGLLAKTGTTSELVDAWLDGYTPDYSTVVWMGYPKKDIPMTDVHGEPQQGGYLPAEIWHAYMAAVTEGQPCAQFAPSKEQITYEPFASKFASVGNPTATLTETFAPTTHHSSHSGHAAPKLTPEASEETQRETKPEATQPSTEEPAAREPAQPPATGAPAPTSPSGGDGPGGAPAG